VYNGRVDDISLVFIELGSAIIGLAILTRLASRLGFSAIPLYLLAGLAFGTAAFFPFNSVKNLFISVQRSALFFCCLCWVLNIPAKS
jgi:NhaP-type Na+/H+ or K+/H+ antiporter